MSGQAYHYACVLAGVAMLLPAVGRAQGVAPVSGFPVALRGAPGGGLLIADLDGNKKLDIITTAGDQVVVVSASGDERKGFPVSLAPPRSESDGPRVTLTFSGAPAACDVDGDGKLEIVVASSDKNLHAVSVSGQEAKGFPVALEGVPKGPVSCSARPKAPWPVYLTTAKGQLVRVLAGKPSVLASVGEGVESGVGLGDVNGDGQEDCVVAGGDGVIYAVDGQGKSLFKTTYKMMYRSSGVPAFGDIDGDDEYEIIVASQDFRVHALELDGTPVKEYPLETGYRIYAGVALGDLDQDGVLDVVVGSADKREHAFRGDGKKVKGFPVALEGQLVADLALGDLDKDGTVEILAVTSSGSLYVLTHAGKTAPGFPIHIGGKLKTAPAIADLDGDGKLELLAQSGEALHAYRLQAQGSAKQALAAWPMLGHGPQHKGWFFPNPAVFKDIGYDNEAPTTDASFAVIYTYRDLDADPEGATQIRWFLDDKLVPQLNNQRTVGPEHTKKRQRWKYSLQDSTNFKAFGESGPLARVFSAPPLIIKNTPPSRPEVQLGPEDPISGSELVATATAADVDGDALSLRYAWLRDGVLQRALSGPKVPAGTVKKGETWEVMVAAHDGDDEGESAVAEVVVHNTAPTKPEIGIEPSLPRVGEAVRVKVMKAASDLDRDVLTYRYSYWVDDRPLHLPESTDVIPPFTLRKHSRVRISVAAFDGEVEGPAAEAELTVANTPPPPPTGRVLWPREPRTNDALFARVVDQEADADGDAIGYRYEWLKNGQKTSYQREVPASATRKDERWTLVLTPFDGEALGAEVRAEVVIENTPPPEPSVILGKQEFDTSERIEPLVKVSEDDDGDPVRIELQWVRNDEPQRFPKEQRWLGPELTRRDDVWEVWAYTSDGQANSDRVRRRFTISNSRPSAPGINVTPEEPTTRSELRVLVTQPATDPDGDPVSYRYYWFRNGLEMADWPMNKAQLGKAELRKGDVWRVEVTADDGEAEGEAHHAEFRVRNHPPDKPRVSIKPAQPTTLDPLVCKPERGEDADEDRIVYRTAWFVDGQPQPFSLDMDVVPPALTYKGQSWHCEVTAFDGTDASEPARATAVVVANSPPGVPKVRLEPALVTTETELRCVLEQPSTDDDRDLVTYEYRWRKNNAPFRPKGVGRGEGVVIIPPGIAKRGEQWGCEIVPSDGQHNGPAGRAVVRVDNAVPPPPVVRLSPAQPVAGDTLRCEIISQASDSDGDKVSYSFAWQKDGEPQAFAPSSVEVPGRFVKERSLWRCIVTAADGTGEGKPARSDEVAVGAGRAARAKAE